MGQPKLNSSTTDDMAFSSFEGETISEVPKIFLNQLNELIQNCKSQNQLYVDAARLQDEALNYLKRICQDSDDDQHILLESAISSIETIKANKLKSYTDYSAQTGKSHASDPSRYYRTLLENTRDITAVIDRNSTIKFVNPTINQLIDYRVEEVINHTIFDFVHPNDREKVTRFYTALMHNHHLSNSIEFRLKHKNGGWLYFEGIGKNLLDDPTIAGMIFTCRDISERKHVEKKLYRTIQQNKMLATRSRQIRENERHSISRELHDDLGQAMSLLNMDIQLLDQKLQSYLDPQKRKEFDDDFENLHHSVQSIIETIQGIVYNLRPPILDNLGLDEAISWQADKFSNSNMSITVDCGLHYDPPEPNKTGLFRIFQEVMTNVYRHSKAENVTIITRSTTSHISLLVSDDGVGLPKDKINGVNSSGLLGMQERVKEMKGKISFTSEPGKGTTVSVKIPCGDGETNQ